MFDNDRSRARKRKNKKQMYATDFDKKKVQLRTMKCERGKQIFAVLLIVKRERKAVMKPWLRVGVKSSKKADQWIKREELKNR